MTKPAIRRRWKAPVAGYLFISPWLIGFLALTIWPMAMSLYYSFTNYNLLEPQRWVGLANYTKIFTNDSVFVESLKVTLTFVMTAVPVKLLVALIVALILNRRIKGIALYRTVLYFPTLIGSSVAISILWRNIWGINGFVNRITALFGMQPVSWISDPRTALGTLIALGVWQFGSSMVIFLAGLKQIPVELYEAGSMDGATRLGQFFHITLPSLSPLLLFNFVLQTIGAFQVFTQAYIITQGGPMRVTFMYALNLYEHAFTRLEMGYASALAWILLVVIAFVTALIFASSRFWVFYETEAGGTK
jgi:multiple sugar transport system permease protein